MSSWEYTERELWRFSDKEISIYHVFGLCAIGSTVLAFAEARYAGGGDASAPHDIVMKKSEDGGLSFGESITLLPSQGKRCFCNPTPLVDRQTGRVFLAFAENFGNARTALFLMHSDDCGNTWSAPRDITAALQKTALPFALPGPGHGIQIQKGAQAGRLLLQVWHRGGSIEPPRDARGYCISLLYSDDHGAHWTQTSPIGAALCCNESRLIEAQDALVWSIRCFDGTGAIAYGNRDSLSFPEPVAAPLPVANLCDAGGISLSAGGKYADTVLVSRISGTQKGERRDMRIHISTDGGKHFDACFALPGGDAMPGYSDLCVIEGEVPTVGLLHCRCNHVLFSRISLQALTGGDFEQTERHVWKSV